MIFERKEKWMIPKWEANRRIFRANTTNCRFVFPFKQSLQTRIGFPLLYSWELYGIIFIVISPEPWKKKPGCWGFIRDIILLTYWGSVASHYKDPYQTTSTTERKAGFLFVADLEKRYAETNFQNMLIHSGSQWFHFPISHSIHVWYIYLHLPSKSTKFR